MCAYSIKRLLVVIATDACTLVVSSNIFPWHASEASGHIAKIISTDIAEKVFIGSFSSLNRSRTRPQCLQFRHQLEVAANTCSGNSTPPLSVPQAKRV